MRLAQSYIVRIYVRVPSGVLKGTVEIVRTGERYGFASSQELLRILMHGRAASTAATTPRTTRRVPLG